MSSTAWGDAGVRLGVARTVDPVPTSATQITRDGDACLLSDGTVLSAALSSLDGFELIRVTAAFPDGGIEPFGRPLSVSVVETQGPRIACSASAALVVYNEYGVLVGTLVDATGSRTPPVVLATNGNPVFPPAVAATTSGFVVTWHDAANAVRARRVSSTGSLLDLDGGAVLALNATTQALSKRGGRWLAWGSGSGIRFFDLEPPTPSAGTSALLAGFRPRTLSVSTLADGGPLIAWSEAFDGGMIARAWAGQTVSLPPVGPSVSPNPMALVDSAGRATLIAGTGDDVRALDLVDGGVRVLSQRSFNHRPLAADALGSRSVVFSTNNQLLNFGWVELDGGTLEAEGFARAEGHQYDFTLTGARGEGALYFWRLGIGQNRNQTLEEATILPSGAALGSPRRLLADCCSSNLGASSRLTDTLVARLRLTANGYDSEVLSVPRAGPIVTLVTPTAGQPNGSGSAVGLGGSGDRVLTGWRNDTNTVLWRITGAGVDSTAVVIPSGNADPVPTPMAITAVAGGFWVAWSTRFSALLRTAWVVDGPVVTGGLAPFQASSLAVPPAVASLGSRGLVLWAAPAGVQTAPLWSDGGVGPAVLLANPSDRVSGLTLAAIDGGYLAAWTSGLDPARLDVARLDADGQAAGGPDTVVTGRVRDPSLAAVPDVLLAWRELEAPSQTWRVRVAALVLEGDGGAGVRADGGLDDAGVKPDAGTDVDAGESADGGAAEDAGQGAGSDAGLLDGGPTAPDDRMSGERVAAVGCGCQASAGGWCVLAGLFAWVLRRHRRSSTATGTVRS